MGWLDRVTAISFPTHTGLCYVSFSYGASSEKSTPGSLHPVLQGLPYGGSYDIFSDVKTGPNPATAAGVTVTPAMKSGLYQWTPTKAYERTFTTSIPPTFINFVTTGAVIDAGNFLDPYPGFDQCGTQVDVIGAYGGTVFNCNPQLLGQAVFAGFNPNKIVRGFGFGGQFPDLASAQYYAAAFNATFYSRGSGLTLSAGRFLYRPGGSLFQREGRANFVINFGLIASKLLKGKTTFDFVLKGTPPSSGAGWLLDAGITKLTAFPVDSKNTPVFKPLPDVHAFGAGTDQMVVTGTIDVKNKTVTLSSSGGSPPPPG